MSITFADETTVVVQVSSKSLNTDVKYINFRRQSSIIYTVCDFSIIVIIPCTRHLEIIALRIQSLYFGRFSDDL